MSNETVESIVNVTRVGQALLASSTLPAGTTIYDIGRYLSFSEKEIIDLFGGGHDSFSKWLSAIRKQTNLTYHPRITDTYFPGSFERSIPNYKVSRFFSFMATFPDLIKSLPFFFPCSVESYKDLRLMRGLDLKAGDLDYEIGVLAGISQIQAWRWKKKPDLRMNSISARNLQIACYLLYVEVHSNREFLPNFDQWLSFCQSQVSLG